MKKYENYEEEQEEKIVYRTYSGIELILNKKGHMLLIMVHECNTLRKPISWLVFLIKMILVFIHTFVPYHLFLIFIIAQCNKTI